MIEIVGSVRIEGSHDPAPGLVVDIVKAANGPATTRSRGAGHTIISSGATNGRGEFRIKIASDGKRVVPFSLIVRHPADDGVLHRSRQTWAIAEGRIEPLIELRPTTLRTLRRPAVQAAADLERSRLQDARHEAIRNVAADEIIVERDRRRKYQVAITDALRGRATEPYTDDNQRPLDVVVAPGTSINATLRKSFGRILRLVVNAGKVTAHTDIAESDRVLRDNSGAPIPNPAATDVERQLFGTGHRLGATRRLRRDIVAAACRPAPAVPIATNASGGGPAPAVPAPAPSQPATLSQIKDRLGKLLDDTEYLASRPIESLRRATATDIGEGVGRLQLQPGPADVTAEYDIERLFVAFEPIVRPEPDPWHVDTLVDIATLVEDLGGDIRSHVRRGLDLVEAVEAEAKVLSANMRTKLGGVHMTKMWSITGALGSVIGVGGDILEGAADVASDVAGGIASGIGSLIPGGGGGHTTGNGNGDSNPTSTTPPPPPPRNRYAELEGLLRRLDGARCKPYGFTPYPTTPAERAVNYGLLLTYRQRWKPRSYQVGELVKTVPLAPKSNLRYTVKRKRHSTYADKRIESAESTYASEIQATGRDIDKIVRNAKVATAFSLAHEAGTDIPGVGSSSTSSTWTTSAEKSSESTKESFREEVRKQSEQVRRSVSTEVSTSITDEVDIEESSELANPNDELVVTYLFYELQRRYTVSERLERVSPVILVAQDLPTPSMIDELWITRHDWILRRVLLDKSFWPALDAVATGKLAADRGRVREQEANLDRQIALVESLKGQLTVLRSAKLLPDPRNFVEQWMARLYDEKDSNWRQDEDKVRKVFGDEVADRLAERLKNEERIEGELKREVAQLESAMQTFDAAYASYATEEVQYRRLALHFRDNIVYYHRAILDHEIADQRFLRLKGTKVPEIGGSLSYKLRTSAKPPRAPTWLPPVEVEITPNLTVAGEIPLERVADLASPLGYHGNAIVFPLTRWDPLVELMMAPYASSLTGVADPDDQGNLTTEELEQLIRCVTSRMSPQELARLTPAITATWEAKLAGIRPDSLDVVIPSGSLYIEALPGSHPLLEDFKLLHRGYDVAMVGSDLVSRRLEQLRLASRLVQDIVDDPDTEKVIIRGDGTGDVVLPT